jgi:tripartite-type tricarboxylate transporter receptor subunit TctC
MFSRCTSALCLLAATIGGLPQTAAASDFPTRRIDLVVPFGAGGSSDVYGRLFAQKSQELLGQPMVVLNRSGAGGAIGLISVAKAAADGYTIALAGTNLAMGKAVNPAIGYDPVKDFVPVANLITQAVFVAVNASSRITSIGQYIEEARKNPGKLNYGSSGIGGSTHFAGEFFKMVTGAQIINVPIREGAVVTLLGGHVDSIFVNTPDIVSHVRNGKIRALATTTLARVPQIPDVPTVAESGFPNFNVVSWIGITAPAGTPAAVVDRLAAYFEQVSKDPKVRDTLGEMGASVTFMAPRDFSQWVQSETRRWTQVANELNIRAQ